MKNSTTLLLDISKNSYKIQNHFGSKIMNNIIIRPMMGADIHDIHELMCELNESFDTIHVISETAIAASFDEMHIRHDVYHNYVAVLDGNVVGMISAVLYKTFFHAHGTLVINEITVSG